MGDYYLAIDIGATSGRHILGHIENGELLIEEVFRFKNNLIKEGDNLYWDLDYLFQNIIDGMKTCKKINKIPKSLGIDTFGVDYALLDNNDQLIRRIYSYRDSRTNKSKEELHKSISVKDLYLKTGIYPQTFNTIYQLYDDYMKGELSKAETVIFLPCYLGYLLTGVKSTELSIASTSGLLNKNSFEFDSEILNLMNIKGTNFPKMFNSGDTIGTLTTRIQEEVGYNCELKCVFSHDTASACFGANVEENEVFLSSGTWSLIGLFADKMIASEVALKKGFTNELNDKKHVRFLKNIIGMFIINEVVKEQNENKSIIDVVNEAKEGFGYNEIFNPTDNRFLAPKSMITEIKSYFVERGIEPPSTSAELYYCVYHSLASCYKNAIEEIKQLTNVDVKCIKIFGGGSNNLFLNELTEKKANIKVIKEASEATAIGNLMCQIK